MAVVLAAHLVAAFVPVTIPSLLPLGFTFWTWSSLVEPSANGCDDGCGSHGICRDGACHCDMGWTGENCRVSTHASVHRTTRQRSTKLTVALTGRESVRASDLNRRSPHVHTSATGMVCARWASASATRATRGLRASEARSQPAQKAVAAKAGACLVGRPWRCSAPMAP